MSETKSATGPEAVRVKGGVQVQFNDGRVGFVRLCDAESLAYKIIKAAGK